jgi:hypothetical protein
VKVVLLPSLQSWWAILLTVTGTCGVSIALAEFAQGKGKALEPKLISFWDQLPSVSMLITCLCGRATGAVPSVPRSWAGATRMRTSSSGLGARSNSCNPNHAVRLYLAHQFARPFERRNACDRPQRVSLGTPEPLDRHLARGADEGIRKAVPGELKPSYVAAALLPMV